jgi:hypothetical protein
MSTTATRTAEIAAAREADERIAAAWEARHEADKLHAEPARERLAYSRRMRKHLRGDEILAADARIEERLAALRALYAEHVQPLEDAAKTLDRELYTGWTRFYLVKHIHNTTACSSFRPGTKIGWLPNLSGQTEAEAVAEHGAILCTKCFPSAPVEMTDGRGVPSDGTCPGSGSAFDPARPNTAGLYFGPQAECPSCGQQVALKSRHSSQVRKHKA